MGNVTGANNHFLLIAGSNFHSIAFQYLITLRFSILRIEPTKCFVDSTLLVKNIAGIKVHQIGGIVLQ